MSDEQRADVVDGEPALPEAPPQSVATPARDIPMTDVVMDQPSSPVTGGGAAISVPPRTETPAQGSRAASVHPDPGSDIPSEVAPHGDPTRRYLNTKVTGALLEGMKQLAKEHDPLRVLGEFLLQKSKELESSAY